jgi:hypothetical protein
MRVVHIEMIGVMGRLGLYMKMIAWKLVTLTLNIFTNRSPFSPHLTPEVHSFSTSLAHNPRTNVHILASVPDEPDTWKKICSRSQPGPTAAVTGTLNVDH